MERRLLRTHFFFAVMGSLRCSSGSTRAARAGSKGRVFFPVRTASARDRRPFDRAMVEGRFSSSWRPLAMVPSSLAPYLAREAISA